MVVHESREAIPSGFVKVGAAPASQTLTLRLGLQQGDIAGLEGQLMDVSTPSSANYGKFLTKEQVEAYVAPKQETVDAINQFLSSNGISSKAVSPAGDIISIQVTVEQANALFSAQFNTFKHVETDTETVRTLQYSIPETLKGALSFVHPTTMFPVQLQRQPLVTIPLPSAVNTNLSSRAVPSSCSSVVTPTCVQDFYGIPLNAANNTNNFIAVTGFINQYANQNDLRSFLSALRTDVSSSTTFTLQTLDGGSNPQGTTQAGVEANLDVQMTIGLATGVPTVFLSVGANQNDNVFGFLDYFLGEANPPSVVTTSYGSNEVDISASVARSLCNAYMQLGARGTSILFASGDGGVSGSQSSSCAIFVPTFPSGCPYMTSVGATTGWPETGASFSSGGFSNVFPRPSYQDAAVSSFLTKLGSTYSGRYNASGRAFPDVSAIGDNVEIVWEGSGGLVAGTSCSSPIFASVIALLNDELESAGKSRLGFLNPFLYSTGASALNDITSGNNPGCNSNGFSAGVGWDPVTGLGTPNFAALRAAVGL
ncbi:family S53 protease [Vararia minispora EC-137]|uniref:Family S53 protease n=1 Tax=Vararia minispora EC-137 TaxID=1314806 RepID=A0ACB8QD78_9AGAM|nr:family S53 protease [Vararia minispora EC-137]